jgi:hypothetical protein
MVLGKVECRRWKRITGNPVIALINTRLQPGGGGIQTDKPFQWLAGAGKTVKTVLAFLVG